MEQEGVLLEWINTFPALQREVKALSELSDGIALYESLAEMAPECCDLSLLKRDAESNWVLRLNNLRKLVNSLLAFYGESSPYIEEINAVNTTAIAKNASPSDIVSLMKSVLGVAVQCRKKQDYVTRIMSLQPESQHQLMHMIQEIMSAHKAPPPPEDSSSKSSEEVSSLTERCNSLQKELEDLQDDLNSTLEKNKSLSEEKEQLLSVVNDLEKRLEESEQKQKELAESGSSNAQSLLSPLTEAEKIDLVQLQQLQYDLEQREEELAGAKKLTNTLMADVRKLRDENDVLNERVGEQQQELDRFSSLKKKLELQSELKDLLKNAEQQCETYMKRNLELEEQLAEYPKMKARIQSLTSQISDLKAAKAILEKAVQQNEEKLAQTSALLEESKTELQVLKSQNSSLEASLQQHSLEPSLPSTPQMNFSGDDSHLSLSFERYPPQLKERMARLEFENDKLAKKVEEAQALISTLQSSQENEQEEAVAKLAERRQLEESLKHLQQENDQLKAQMSTLEQNLAQQMPNPHSESVEELTKKLEESREQIAKLESEKSKLQAYLRTAKTMITKEKAKAAAAASQANQPPEDVQLQLQQKEKEVESLRSKMKESQNCYNREQRLLVSAFYEMAMDLQRVKHTPSLPQSRTGAKPTSFLGRKRLERR